MILSDSAILKAMDAQDILIRPFDAKALGGNSYDVHLAPLLVRYQQRRGERFHEPLPLDCKIDNPVFEEKIESEGYVLHPGVLYLASTVEYTETHKHVPYLDGK